MSEKKSRPADEILSEALDLPADERRAFVERECSGDEERQRDVLSLLAAFEAADDFMETPVDFPGAHANSLIGTKVGVYRLVESIGTGGMGVVYLGERDDGEFSQRVAVKLIRHALMGKEAVRRFRNECRVLAMLEHPNIARMIDGGFTEDGTPYIAMEYVDGMPIDRYCDQRQLGVEQRLDLFRSVCAAVQHAHKHSTIHRDIKPGNILVTHDGQAKLVDFGIARVLDAADEADERTATGLEMMTPQYASPEQLRGEILSTASDVYSLGVVLFKLLAGRPPFTEKSRTALERLVSETMPSRPSDTIVETSDTATAPETRRRSRRLRGDLDTIVMMALRKEPDRRYASVEQFSEDIRRHLSGQPVSAQPDTFGYRARKFVRRNTAAVIAGAAVVLVLLAATAISVALYARAEGQRRLAEERETQLEVEVAKSRATSQFLQDMLSSADPRVTGRDVRVADLLEPARESAREQFADQPEVAAELHGIVGTTYVGLGLVAEAIPALEEAYELRKAVHGENHGETWWALADLGSAVADEQRWSDADSLLRLAFDGLRATYGPEHDRTLHCQTNLAVCLTFAGQHEEAERLTREALELRTRIWGESDQQTLTLMHNLGRLYQGMGRLDEAEPLLVESVEKLEELLGDRHPEVLVAYSNLVILYFNTSRIDKAEHYARIAWEAQVEILGESHPDALSALSNLAYMQMAQGNAATAAESYSTALALAEQNNPEEHYLIALLKGNKGESLVALEQFEEAEQLLTASYRGFREILGGDERNSFAINRLVTLYDAWGKPGQSAMWRDKLPADS